MPKAVVLSAGPRLKILAYAKYGAEAASTRQRILQYAGPLADAGIELECQILLGDHYVRSIASGTRASAAAVGGAYLRRMSSLLRRPAHDLYWVYADLLPYMPPALDRLLFAKKRPVVVDWDDAFHENYARHANPVVRALFATKLDSLLARADAVTCGNRYLYDHVGRFARRRLIVPTVVDTDVYRPDRGEGPLTIGWIGSPSTWKNCRHVLPALADACERFDARFLIVGAGPAAASDRHPRFEFVDWSQESEVARVQSMDVGISPMLDEPFQRGKSGYKLIQYMACGVPCLASPVGSQAEILEGETAGLLARDEADWPAGLAALLSDAHRRKALGKAGRALAVERYSLQSQAPRLIALFNELSGR